MLTHLAPPQIRATTGLELAAGVFTKCSDRLATQISVSLTSGKRDARQTELRIGINGDIYGGMRAPLEIGTRRVDIAYVNPAALVTMAYRGKGYYKQKMELRVLGCFPSWDRIALVVDKNLGVKSLSDIVRRKIPLHVSTRPSGVNNGTYFTISTILSLYGLSFDKIKRWGGKVQECGRRTNRLYRNRVAEKPLSPTRRRRADDRLQRLGAGDASLAAEQRRLRGHRDDRRKKESNPGRRRSAFGYAQSLPQYGKVPAARSTPSRRGEVLSGERLPLGVMECRELE